MISFQGVTTTLGSFHLGPLDFTIEAGEHVLIVGPSGSGKSLILELVAGFQRTTRGTIQLDNKDAQNLPPRQRGCAWLPQAHTLFPHLSVAQNIGFGLRAQGTGKVDIDAAVQTMADRVGIADLLQRRPTGLSGGERQRVALARALVAGGRILLLDEPFSALDRPRRAQLRSLVLELHSELAPTILHVTHDVSQIRGFPGRVMIMLEGQLEQLDSADDVLQSPASTACAALIGIDISDLGEE